MSVETLDISGFKPATLADQPQPMLIWAKLSDLVIDRRYQRSITAAGRRAIQRMANNFDWKKYQPILVAPHEGGKLAVVDGQHRSHAAALCGIEELPAMTVPMTIAEQAAGFAAINRDQIRIDNCALYRAELAAGTEWALKCRDAVEAAGCSLATANASSNLKKPGVIYAVNLVRRMVMGGEGDAVTTGLAGIRQSQAGTEREAYIGPVITVWLAAVASNQQFLKLDLARAFDGVDIIDALDRAKIVARRDGGSARPRAISEVVDHLRGELSEERAA